jgi:integrase/recombinase XerD
MNTSKATATVFLDTRRMKKSGNYPVKLQIYYNGKAMAYATGLDASEKDWEKTKADRVKDEFVKELRTEKRALISAAETILKEMPAFSFQEFERIMFKKKEEAPPEAEFTLKDWFEKYIKQLDEQRREGTRSSYQTTLNSILAFHKNKSLRLQEITTRFLEEYEAWMAAAGKSPSTQGIYLRQLRAIINQAIKAGVIKQENYPFKGFSVPAARNVKKALTDSDLRKLLSYSPQNPSTQKAHDYWKLSYFCNGMNMVDILNLKKSDVTGNQLQFFRQKTKRTKKKDLRPIKVYLSPDAISIIYRYRSQNHTSPYLFPTLEGTESPKTQKQRCQRFIKMVNKGLKEISDELGFETAPTTYAARHSFATRLMRSGVPTMFLKESLGHSSAAVTEMYLSSFEDEQAQAFTGALLNF